MARKMMDRPGTPKHIMKVCWKCLVEAGTSSTHTSSRTSLAFQGRLESPRGQCSVPSLLRWLHRAEAIRLLVPVTVAIPQAPFRLELRYLFMSQGRMDQKNRQINAASAVMQTLY